MHTSSLSCAPAFSPGLLAALTQPFVPQQVELRIGVREQRGQRWVCQTIPFVPRRFYEDRLNALVPGAWSSSTPSMVETAGRLVIAAQVQILGVIHTGYGERPLRPSVVLAEKEAVAPNAHAAFEDAFVGACACFGLGRYLADLAHRWVPYEPRHRKIYLSPTDQFKLVLTLYREAHIPLAFAKPGRQLPSYPGWPPYEPGRSLSEGANDQPGNDVAARLRMRDLNWVRERCNRTALQRIYDHFQIVRLEELTDRQLLGIINGMHAHAPWKASA